MPPIRGGDEAPRGEVLPAKQLCPRPPALHWPSSTELLVLRKWLPRPRTKEPRNQGTKEPRNQGTKEPRNQGTKEPRNQACRLLVRSWSENPNRLSGVSGWADFLRFHLYAFSFPEVSTQVTRTRSRTCERLRCPPLRFRHVPVVDRSATTLELLA